MAGDDVVSLLDYLVEELSEQTALVDAIAPRHSEHVESDIEEEQQHVSLDEYDEVVQMLETQGAEVARLKTLCATQQLKLATYEVKNESLMESLREVREHHKLLSDQLVAGRRSGTDIAATIGSLITDQKKNAEQLAILKRQVRMQNQRSPLPNSHPPNNYNGPKRNNDVRFGGQKRQRPNNKQHGPRSKKANNTQLNGESWTRRQNKQPHATRRKKTTDAPDSRDSLNRRQESNNKSSGTHTNQQKKRRAPNHGNKQQRVVVQKNKSQSVSRRDQSSTPATRNGRHAVAPESKEKTGDSLVPRPRQNERASANNPVRKLRKLKNQIRVNLKTRKKTGEAPKPAAQPKPAPGSALAEAPNTDLDELMATGVLS